MNEYSIEITETPVVVDVIGENGEEAVLVEIATAGPQGIPGPQGAQGLQGPPGSGSYVHVQSVPATVWTVQHNLEGGYPNVTVIDSAGTRVEGDITYPAASTVVLTFTSAFSGTAYLS